MSDRFRSQPLTSDRSRWFQVATEGSRSRRSDGAVPNGFSSFPAASNHSRLPQGAPNCISSLQNASGASKSLQIVLHSLRWPTSASDHYRLVQIDQTASICFKLLQITSNVPNRLRSMDIVADFSNHISAGHSNLLRLATDRQGIPGMALDCFRPFKVVPNRSRFHQMVEIATKITSSFQAASDCSTEFQIVPHRLRSFQIASSASDRLRL